LQEADRMSGFPLRIVALLFVLSSIGCYPPMYQQAPYGQQMYGPQGNFAPSGTIVVPPSNAPLYAPGSTYTAPSQTDSFAKPAESKDERYFGSEGSVPLPSDAGTGTGTRPFDNDLQTNP
jgi:hypothetical protein